MLLEEKGWPSNWSPLPVHTIPGKEDYVRIPCQLQISAFSFWFQLLNYGLECPMYNSLQTQVEDAYLASNAEDKVGASFIAHTPKTLSHFSGSRTTSPRSSAYLLAPVQKNCTALSLRFRQSNRYGTCLPWRGSISAFSFPFQKSERADVWGGQYSKELERLKHIARNETELFLQNEKMIRLRAGKRRAIGS